MICTGWHRAGGGRSEIQYYAQCGEPPVLSWPVSIGTLYADSSWCPSSPSNSLLLWLYLQETFPQSLTCFLCLEPDWILGHSSHNSLKLPLRPLYFHLTPSALTTKLSFNQEINFIVTKVSSFSWTNRHRLWRHVDTFTFVATSRSDIEGFRPTILMFVISCHPTPRSRANGASPQRLLYACVMWCRYAVRHVVPGKRPFFCVWYLLSKMTRPSVAIFSFSRFSRFRKIRCFAPRTKNSSWMGESGLLDGSDRFLSHTARCSGGWRGKRISWHHNVSLKNTKTQKILRYYLLGGGRGGASVILTFSVFACGSWNLNSRKAKNNCI